MKTHVAILLLFLLIFSSMGIGQTISEAEKQQVLQNLQFDGFLSGDDVGGRWDSVIAALDKVEKYKIAEAGPVIKSKIWWCEFVVQHKMMLVLYYLKDPDVLSVTRALVDTAERILAGSQRKHPEYFENATAVRYNAILQLFDLGDFSYANVFVQEIRERGSLWSYGDLFALGSIAKAVPAHRDFAEKELLKVMYADTTQNGADLRTAAGQIYWLVPNYLSDFTTFFERTDNDAVNSSLAEIIAPLRYPPFEQALKLKLSTNRELTFHDDYMVWLLEYYGTIENYQFVVNYFNNQQDEYMKQRAERELLVFKPDTPSVSISVSALIDSLLSLTQQSQNLNWLGNQNYVKELTNHLTNAKKHLNKKDSLKCAQEVEKFQSKVNREYKEASTRDNRFVTIEGWKFLYYNAQYIIERLVKLPVKSQGTLLQQIDELKAEVTRQSGKKNLGGVLLVKSLTFLADQAKKQLQKPLPSTNDSAKAALSIAAFQLVVDETWELTKELSGKGKKFAALFVYDEAYIQLHYRAKYLLEALPAPRTLIDMKSVEMDEETRKELDAMRQMNKEQ